LTSSKNDFAHLVFHLEESFSEEEAQFKKFCPPVKTICPPVENVNETPAKNFARDKSL